MSGAETFVNYALQKDLYDAHKAGVFPDMGVEGEDEERHISELERRIKALDEKEVYVTVKTCVDNHAKTVAKTLIYLEKQENKKNMKKTEGEQQINDSND